MVAETPRGSRWPLHLPDRLNPRVWLRNWLNKQTVMETAAAEERHQAVLARIRARAQREAADRTRLSEEITASQQRFDQSLAGISDCAVGEAMLAGQLRELLSRTSPHSGESHLRPELGPGASAAPAPSVRDPGSVDRLIPGEEG